ncbi:MAG: hypothetical protein EXR52_06075 [Dehalococcoidia bacterium]|nr:hypothetical protein [Dehalococcoidia bacterium]
MTLATKLAAHDMMTTAAPTRLTHTGRWAVCITLLAFLLRLTNLGGQSLWYDEVYHALLSRPPVPDLLQRVASDTNQPLSFLLLHLWGADTALEFYLRFPSVLAGTLAVPLLWATGRLLLPPAAALAGALALAVAPFPVFYGQELRMYGELLALLALAGFGFTLGWVRGERRGWVLFSAATAGALYTHTLGALPCLALAAWAVLDARGDWRRLRGVVAALGVAALAFVPWIAVTVVQLNTVLTTFWAPAPAFLAPLLSLYQVLMGPFGGPALFVLGLALVLASLGVTLPAMAAGRPHARALALLWVWAVLPVVGLFLVSQVRSVYLDRVVIGVSLPLCLLLGWVATELRPRLLGASLGVGLLAIAGWSLGNWYWSPAQGKPLYREAAQLVMLEAGLHEPVLHTSDGSLLLFLVYAPAHRNLLLAGDPEQDAATSRARSTQVVHPVRPVALEPAILGRTSFWLVVSLDHSVDYQRAVAADIDDRYRRVAEKTLGGLVVRRYAH